MMEVVFNLLQPLGQAGTAIALFNPVPVTVLFAILLVLLLRFSGLWAQPQERQGRAFPANSPPHAPHIEAGPPASRPLEPAHSQSGRCREASQGGAQAGGRHRCQRNGSGD
jgi:hypothetical protein